MLLDLKICFNYFFGAGNEILFSEVEPFKLDHLVLGTHGGQKSAYF